MKEISYFIYDNENNLNCNKSLNIKTFKYNSETLIWDFYKELLQEYVYIKYDGASSIDELSSLIYFKIIDVRGFRVIDESICDSKIEDLLNDLETKLLIIFPILPIGATMASYKNIKIVIHSNEDVHLNYPHVHIIGAGYDDIFINLNTFDIIEGEFKDKKIKKKILAYLEGNQKKLLDYYDDVVNHKTIDKVNKDIII